MYGTGEAIKQTVKYIAPEHGAPGLEEKRRKNMGRDVFHIYGTMG